jgi:hypothetical protein
MNPSVETVATLTVFGAAPTRAAVTVVTLNLGRRMGRALGALAACWGAAVVAVFIPVAHFLLVPALAVAGVIWAFLRFRERERLVRIHGTCPRCGRADDFVPGGSEDGKLVVSCPGCRNRLLVTRGAAPPPFAHAAEDIA